MKRICCLLVILAALFSFATAEDFDLSGLSYDELRALRDRVEAEMVSRGLPEPGEVVFESEIVRVAFVGADRERTASGTRFTVTVEWTNLADYGTALALHVGADAYVDGVFAFDYSADEATRLRPGASLQVTYSFRADDGAELAELILVDRHNRDAEIRVFTFHLE